ncbi:hypothetical protein KR032_000355, partial [Drosophila birchii]
MDKSVLEWKNANIYSTMPFTKCPNTADITSYCINENNAFSERKKIRMVLCDQHGNIHVYYSDWECVSFKSQHPSDTIIACALTSNYLLVTVIHNAQYKLYIDLYDIRRLTKKKEAPIIASASYPQVISSVACVTAEVIDEKSLALGIGFGNGDILLHYGKICRDFTANLCRHTISSNPIIGIHFDQLCNLSTQNMFITCIHGVYCFLLKDKGFIDKIFVLDNEKSHYNHCCIMRKPACGDYHESMLVVGQEDAIYCYTRDGRGPCFAIEGKKKCLNWEGHNLIIVVKPIKSLLKQSSLIVVDTENKIIVFHSQIPDVFCITSEHDLFFILSCDKNYALILKQHNMSKKIGFLINQNMYEIALRFLDREGRAFSPEASSVRFQYGNHLLHRGEIRRAVQEYTKTIGFIKPYSVISKLLCSRYNDYLKDYLLELKKKKTSSHHLKLLEFCSKRNQLKKNIKQLKDEKTNTRLMDVIQVVRIPKIYIEPMLENQCDFLEVNLLKCILEYADKRQIVDFSTLFKNDGLEILNSKSKNMLCFLYILSEHKEYCVRLLAKIIIEYSTCEKNLYYYLLVLYLELWRASKITKSPVLDFLKKNKLRLEKVLIICTLYKFSCEIGEIEVLNENAVTNNAINKCINKLVEKNPEVAFKLNASRNTFLMVLKNSCTNGAIKAFKLKPLFKEGIIRDIVDLRNDFKIMQNLNNTLKKSNCMLSFYTNNPIEFRNDACDICRQTLNMHSIYFLCQHTFHKECLNYKNMECKEELKCVICNVTSPSLIQKDQQTCNLDSFSVIALISNLVAVGIMKIETESM